jgi:hypothetical protein
MRVLKRDDETGRLIEHHKSMLTLIFADRTTAQAWRRRIEERVLDGPPHDVLAAVAAVAVAAAAAGGSSGGVGGGGTAGATSQDGGGSRVAGASVGALPSTIAEESEDEDDDSVEDDGHGGRLASSIGGSFDDADTASSTAVDKASAPAVEPVRRGTFTSMAKSLGRNVGNSLRSAAMGATAVPPPPPLPLQEPAPPTKLISRAGSGAAAGACRSWVDGPVGQEPSDPASVQGTLVIPTAGIAPRDSEALKIEIARTMSLVAMAKSAANGRGR